jgi:hypothetical protein
MLLDNTIYSILLGAIAVSLLVLLMLLWYKVFPDSNAKTGSSFVIIVVLVSFLIFDKWYALNVYVINTEQKKALIEKKVLIGTAEYDQKEINETLNAQAYQCYVINHTDEAFQINETLYLAYGEDPDEIIPVQRFRIGPHNVELIQISEINYFPGEKLPTHVSSKYRSESKYKLDYDLE